MYESGITGMRRAISDTAKYGDMVKGKILIDAGVRERMRGLLKDIQSGSFAKEWIDEDRQGRPKFNEILETEAQHPIEKVGEQLRSMMSWLDKK